MNYMKAAVTTLSGISLRMYYHYYLLNSENILMKKLLDLQ